MLDLAKSGMYKRTMKSKKYITQKTTKELVRIFGTHANIARNLAISYRLWCLIRTKERPLSPRVKALIEARVNADQKQEA